MDKTKILLKEHFCGSNIDNAISAFNDYRSSDHRSGGPSNTVNLRKYSNHRSGGPSRPMGTPDCASHLVPGANLIGKL